MKKTEAVDIIGLKELISLPSFGIESVPAKIDTGADFSSIWASNISINAGELSFCLFGPGSAFYSGETIKTKEFEVTSIKNSFGIGENRYKVKIGVKIGNRRISGTFTLADRSSMTYPVLIGRKLLKRKFIVDVSRIEVHSKNGDRKEILVLASKPTKGLKEFIANLAADLKTDKAQFEVRAYNELAFSIDQHGLKVFETINNKDIATYNLVYFKSHKNDQIKAAAAAKYLQARNVRFFDKELIGYLSHDKLTQYVQLTMSGLPVPPTLCGSNEYLLKNAKVFAAQWRWPIVLKEIESDRGHNNYLIHDLDELDARIKAANDGQTYMLQKYLPNDGYLRIFVFGNKPQITVARTPHEHKNPQKKHLNNPQGSVNAKKFDSAKLPASVSNMAVNAAKAMNRQIAGVDLISDKDSGSWYILEVNNAPQLRTGSFVDQKQKGLAKFIDLQLSR